MLRYALLLLGLFLLIACNSDSSSSENTTSTTTPNTEVESPPHPTPPLIVNIDNLRLRSTPGEGGEEIARLPKGTLLQDLGEVSDFTTRVRLRGIWFDEPWLKVRTAEQQEGWIYAGAISFDVDDPAELTQTLLRKRLQTFFGAALASQIQQYREAYNTVDNSETFAKVYQTGQALRDTLNYILEEGIIVGDNYDELPDLFWIDETLPGYVPQLVAEGTIYYLFQDFKDFGKKTRQTAGTEDDQYIELNYLVHSHDSVEYFFPAWFIQTWDYGGHSLLGKGKHLAILQAMEKTVKRSPMFETEIFKIRDQLLDDILLSGDPEYSGNGFWEPQEKILEELDKIIAADFSIITKDQKTALQTRRQIIQDAEKNRIVLNQRAGLEGLEE